MIWYDYTTVYNYYATTDVVYITLEPEKQMHCELVVNTLIVPKLYRLQTSMISKLNLKHC